MKRRRRYAALTALESSSGCYFDAEEGVNGESKPGVVRIVL